MLGHPASQAGPTTKATPEKSPDEVLDDITLYWLTDTATSSGRIYWEYGGGRSPVFAGPGEDQRSLAAGGHHGLSGGRLSGPRDVGPARLPAT